MLRACTIEQRHNQFLPLQLTNSGSDRQRYSTDTNCQTVWPTYEKHASFAPPQANNGRRCSPRLPPTQAGPPYTGPTLGHKNSNSLHKTVVSSSYSLSKPQTHGGCGERRNENNSSLLGPRERGVFDVLKEGCFVLVNAGHETSFFSVGKYHTL